MEHNTSDISARRTLSAACFIVFVCACRFSRAPTEELGADTADSAVNVAGSPANRQEPSAQPASSSSSATPAVAAQSGNAAAGSGSAAANPPANAAPRSSAIPPVTALAPPPTAAKPAAAGAPASADLDAGRPDGNKTPSESECSQELADCLLKNPLNLAECLRSNADHGCPEFDAGTSPTSPVITTVDGKPISQACQAEFAACVMRDPRPGHAMECMEMARKCK